MPASVFLWRRFARIWPLLAVSTVTSVAVWRVLGTDFSLRGVAATLGLVNSWIPERPYLVGGNPAAWSLSDEAWFYLIFPLLLTLPLMRNPRGRAVIAVAVCAGSVGVWLSGALLTHSLVRLWALDYFPPGAIPTAGPEKVPAAFANMPQDPYLHVEQPRRRACNESHQHRRCRPQLVKLAPVAAAFAQTDHQHDRRHRTALRRGPLGCLLLRSRHP
ncbi:hypothetical protein SBADM41S_00965 [Streptomyces badius]